MTQATEIQLIGEQQHEQMAQVLNAVGPTVKDTKKMIRQIINYGREIEQPALSEMAQTIGKNVTWLRDVIAQIGSLTAATNGALVATVEARDALLKELKDITDALEGFKTTHPKLVGFVARVEEEMSEGMEADWEDEYFAASQKIQIYLGMPFLVANQYGSQLKDLMFDPDCAWTDTQADLIRQLLDTFVEPASYSDNDEVFMHGGVDD